MQAPLKDGVQNAVHNICLNLHVQVGALSLVFVPRVEAIQQPQAQIGFPFVKKSVRHLYLLTHIPDGSVFMSQSYHKEMPHTRLDKRENTGFS